LSYEDALQRL